MNTHHSMKLESRITTELRRNAPRFSTHKAASVGVDRTGIDAEDIELAAIHYRALGWAVDTRSRYLVLSA